MASLENLIFIILDEIAFNGIFNKDQAESICDFTPI
jgi:hypothetical protein